MNQSAQQPTAFVELLRVACEGYSAQLEAFKISDLHEHWTVTELIREMDNTHFDALRRDFPDRVNTINLAVYNTILGNGKNLKHERQPFQGYLDTQAFEPAGVDCLAKETREKICRIIAKDEDGVEAFAVAKEYGLIHPNTEETFGNLRLLKELFGENDHQARMLIPMLVGKLRAERRLAGILETIDCPKHGVCASIVGECMVCKDSFLLEKDFIQCNKNTMTSRPRIYTNVSAALTDLRDVYKAEHQEEKQLNQLPKFDFGDENIIPSAKHIIARRFNKYGAERLIALPDIFHSVDSYVIWVSFNKAGWGITVYQGQCLIGNIKGSYDLTQKETVYCHESRSAELSEVLINLKNRYRY